MASAEEGKAGTMGRAKAGGERKGCSMDSIMATITQQKETIFRVFCCCQSDASLIANACYCKCICNNMHHRYGAIFMVFRFVTIRV